MPAKLRAREFKRLGQILTAAVKNGFGFVVAEAGLEKYLPRAYRRFESFVTSRYELPRRFRQMLEELGPTFIKLGQILSVRPDILPYSYIEELEKLQDSAPEFPFSAVKEIIESELNRPLEEIYKEFNEKPVAAASLSQVHRARLKDGTEVAVKVQRPEAEEIIETDLNIMRFIAEKASQRITTLDTIALWEELAISLRNEINFLVEADHCAKFYEFFEDDEVIKIPRVFWDYTSKRVLTLEYIYGIPLKDDSALRAEIGEKSLEKLAVYGARAFMRQVLEFGYFHADLHPSNIIITDDEHIAYLDFGMVGRISEEARRAIARMLYAIIRKDIDEIVLQSEVLGARIPRSKIPLLRKELRNALERYYGRTIGEYRIDIIGREFISILHRNNIRIPRDYALLAKALITIEGVGKSLYPDINILEVARPYVEKLVRSYNPPEKLLEQIASELRDDFFILLRLPSKLETALSLIESSVEASNEQTEAIRELSRTVKDSALLLAFAFIASFIAIGLSFLAYMMFSASMIRFLVSSLAFIIFLVALLLVVSRLIFRR